MPRDLSIPLVATYLRESENKTVSSQRRWWGLFVSVSGIMITLMTCWAIAALQCEWVKVLIAGAIVQTNHSEPQSERTNVPQI